MVFLVLAAGDDPDRIVRQRPLERLRLVPRSAHPDIAFLVGGQDHRLGVNWFDDGFRCRGQEAADEVRPGIGFDLVPGRL